MPRGQRDCADVLERLERLFYHEDIGVRATAIDRAGRIGGQRFVLRLQAIMMTPTEPMEVRSAAAFALALVAAPLAVDALQATAAEPSDAGRWAKRACFMLLGTVSLDDQKWLLEALDVADADGIMHFAATLAPHVGTVSERLTKGWIIEKVAIGKWGDEDIDLIALLMFALQQRLIITSKFQNYVTFVKRAAEMLGAKAGDLRHGPLSPALLRRVAQSGWQDAGLLNMFGQRWQTMLTNVNSVNERLIQIPNIHELLI